MGGLEPFGMTEHGVLDALFAAWREASPAAHGCIDVLRSARHGDLPRWTAALAQLPPLRPSDVSFGATVSAGRDKPLEAEERRDLEQALRGLLPWRKGPFDLFGVFVDAEWRSHLKWARVAPHVELAGCRVLDVGCGNGYYGWRMIEAGAESVTGVDPSLLYTLQNAAVGAYLGLGRNLVLPLRLEDLDVQQPFDVVFSMGVAYHRRDPADHVRTLARHTHDQSTVVLESLVVDGAPLKPGRYAAMRNVHVVPNVALLRDWLADAGFRHAELVDVSATTPAEQRATAWMPYHSLADALDPSNPERTVEGYPAPRRAVMIARR